MYWLDWWSSSGWELKWVEKFNAIVVERRRECHRYVLIILMQGGGGVGRWRKMSVYTTCSPDPFVKAASLPCLVYWHDRWDRTNYPSWWTGLRYGITTALNALANKPRPVLPLLPASGECDRCLPALRRGFAKAPISLAHTADTMLLFSARWRIRSLTWSRTMLWQCVTSGVVQRYGSGTLHRNISTRAVAVNN